MTNCQKAQNMFKQTTKINCMTFQKQCAFSSMGTCIVRKVSCSFYSQIKLFIPVGVEVLGDGFCALLDFSDLHGDVRITCTRFIFADQALSTYH